MSQAATDPRLVTRPVQGSEVTALRISIPVGRIELTEGEAGQVHGTLVGEAEAVDACQVDVRDGTLRVELDWRSRPSPQDLELRLSVPAGIELSCRTGAARLVSHVTLGRTAIDTGAGAVVLGEVGELGLRTGAGDVEIDTLSGPGRVVSGAGALRVHRVTAPLSARTGAGTITVGRLEAPLQGSSAAGPFTVAEAVDSIQVKTAAGPISIGIADGVPARLDLRAGLGRVDVDLPPSTPPAAGEHSLTVHARSAMGRIHLHRA